MNIWTEIINIIIPFFNKYPLQGNKRLDYLDFCKVVNYLPWCAINSGDIIDNYDIVSSIIWIRKIKYTFNSINRRCRSFFTESNAKLRSNQRIGPHAIDVISVIIGSTLGDSRLRLAKRKKALGTRIIFEQSNRNVEYLMWFHTFFATRGYCSPEKPRLLTKIAKDNKVFYKFRINTYTFTSLNWLHEMFYKDNQKIIPRNLADYLTPLALAICYSCFT